MTITSLRQPLVVLLLLLLLLSGGVAAAQATTHDTHHAHHDKGTHSTGLCTWMCAGALGLAETDPISLAELWPVTRTVPLPSSALATCSFPLLPSRAPPSRFT